MQDWNYVNTNCFEVTIELGCTKYPLAKELPKYWEQNQRAMLQFIHQVKITNLDIMLKVLPHLHLHLLMFIWPFVSVGSHWSKGYSLWHLGWHRNSQRHCQCGGHRPQHPNSSYWRLLETAGPWDLRHHCLCPWVMCYTSEGRIYRESTIVSVISVSHCY